MRVTVEELEAIKEDGEQAKLVIRPDPSSGTGGSRFWGRSNQNWTRDGQFQSMFEIFLKQ